MIVIEEDQKAEFSAFLANSQSFISLLVGEISTSIKVDISSFKPKKKVSAVPHG